MLKPKEFIADKTITLPSGKVAEIRAGSRRDQMNAQKAIVGNDLPSAGIYALIAEFVQIDGKQIVYEEVVEMRLKDLMVLQEEVLGENFPAPPQPASKPDQVRLQCERAGAHEFLRSGLLDSRG